jgi:hypothetical protein
MKVSHAGLSDIGWSVCSQWPCCPSAWKVPWSKGLVQMTPGVQLAKGGDAMGQQYNTPASVIGQGVY